MDSNQPPVAPSMPLQPNLSTAPQMPSGLPGQPQSPFQTIDAAPQKKTGGFVIILIVLVLLLLLGAGAYYYFIMRQPATPTETAQPIQQVTATPKPDNLQDDLSAINVIPNDSDFADVDKDLQAL